MVTNIVTCAGVADPGLKAWLALARTFVIRMVRLTLAPAGAMGIFVQTSELLPATTPRNTLTPMTWLAGAGSSNVRSASVAFVPVSTIRLVTFVLSITLLSTNRQEILKLGEAAGTEAA